MTVFPDESGFSLDIFRWELEFTLDSIGGEQGLVSRDQSGTVEAGHLSAWLDGNKVITRHQDIDGGHASVRLESQTVFEINRSYIVTISIGPTGFALFVDKQLEASDSWSIGTVGNNLDLVLGGLCTRCKADGSVGPSRPINGTITMRIYDAEADWTPPPPPELGSATLLWTYPVEWDDEQNTPLPMENIDRITVYSCNGIEIDRVLPPLTTYIHEGLVPGEYCYYVTATATHPPDPEARRITRESVPSNTARKTIE